MTFKIHYFSPHFIMFIVPRDIAFPCLFFVCLSSFHVYGQPVLSLTLLNDLMSDSNSGRQGSNINSAEDYISHLPLGVEHPLS